MKKVSTRTELRIVDQVRTMHMRGYDLACESARLRLQIAPAESDGTEPYRVEARMRAHPAGEEVTASASGATRTEALRALAERWRETERGFGMQAFDWEAVEALLVGVRAL